MEIQLTAPSLEVAEDQSEGQKSNGARRHRQRLRRTRVRSRRKSPRTKNKIGPKQWRELLNRLLLHWRKSLPENVERKKAMVSISKPTQRLARRMAALSHITAVRPRKASGMTTNTAAPRPRLAAGR